MDVCTFSTHFKMQYLNEIVVVDSGRIKYSIRISFH